MSYISCKNNHIEIIVKNETTNHEHLLGDILQEISVIADAVWEHDFDAKPICILKFSFPKLLLNDENLKLRRAERMLELEKRLEELFNLSTVRNVYSVRLNDTQYELQIV